VLEVNVVDVIACELSVMRMKKEPNLLWIAPSFIYPFGVLHEHSFFYQIHNAKAS
jgi:hypothetical protein